MKNELTLEDLIAARDAMESWEDAFQDEDPDAATKVRKVLAQFNALIETMSAPNGPRLRLVKPEDVN